MPETRKYETNEMVDIDNSGPEVDVTLPEEKKQEEVQNEEPSDSNKVIVEEVKEDVKEPEQQPEQKTEEPVKEDKVQEDKSVEDKKELEDYSEGVKRRIAKLTKKMREAERQKEAALEYARGVKAEADKTKTKLSTMEPSYIGAMEGRVKSGLQASAAKLAAAREAGDIAAEVEAQKEIARLGLEEARVELMKKKAEAESKRLQGQGIADQRREIAKGIEDSVGTLGSVGINSQEASALIVVTQHYDTLQSIGGETNSNLILLPNSPQAGSTMLNDMVAAFTASSKIGEAMQKENIKSAKNDMGEVKQEPPKLDDPPVDNFEGEDEVI